MLARQRWSPDSTDAVAFAAAIPNASSYSGDRAAFLGRNGSTANPAGLKAVRLDNACGADTDPAAILQVPVTLALGAEGDVVFMLGQAPRVEDVRNIVNTFRDSAAVEQGLTNAEAWWDARLSTLQVETPHLSVDLILNRWLVYQTLSCRFWGRTALYQSSGAFGFRDQLQDCLALLYAAPELARAHILLAASRQFTEGDVQHWWHPGSGTGVRTRCSDDLLWLPYVAAHYISVTGDTGILDEQIAFIEGPALKDGEMEHLFTPEASADRASLWEHCRRAVNAGWRPGQNGLPLIGSCDWNDGLSNVGPQGRGESVWLAWFLLFGSCRRSRNWRIRAMPRWLPLNAENASHCCIKRLKLPPGMANGICAASSTMVRRSALTKIRKRASIPSRSRGQLLLVAATRTAQKRR